MDINEALQQLDPENDSHWTEDGLPRMEVVEGLVGGSVTRKQVTEAAPNFNREAASAQTQDEAEAEAEAEATLSSELEARQSKADELRHAADEALREYQTTQKAVAELEAQIDALKPQEHPQERVQRFLKSQQEQRAAEAERRARILEHVNLEDLLPGNPIDRRTRKRHGSR